MLTHTAYVAYSPKALQSNLSLLPAYSHKIFMQPTAKMLCSQAFQFWMLMYTAYAVYSPKALQSSLSLWDAYSLSIYSPHLKALLGLLLVDAYSQSIYSLQSKNSVKPFTCGCLFTKHMQHTAQTLCQAFHLRMIIHKAKAYTAYSLKALQSNLSSKLEYHIQP